MNILQVMLVIIALQLVALVGLFAATVTEYFHQSGGRIRRLRQAWCRLFPEALAGNRDATTGIRRTLHSRTSYKAFHDFLDEQLRQRRVDSTVSLRRLSRALGFTERLQRQLSNSRDHLDRAAAARTLGRLREKISWEAIDDLLQSKDPAVVLVAGYASASFRHPKHFLTVFRAVYGRTPITLHGAAELLSGFGEGICPVIHKLLDKVVAQYRVRSRRTAFDPHREVDRRDVAAQVVMIDLLAFYAYTPAAPTLVRLLSLTEDEEVQIHLVKALAKVGDATAVPRLTELLSHPNWILRSQAAQALGALNAVEAVTSIHALLKDDNVRVRVYAQRALSSLEALAPPVEVYV